MNKKLDIGKEIEKIYEEIENLRSSLPERSTEYIKEAQQASKKTSEFRNRAEDAKQKAEEYVKQSEISTQKVKEIEVDTISRREKIEEQTHLINSCYNKIKDLQNSIEEIEDVLASHEPLDEKISVLTSFSDSVEQQQNKINAVYKGLTSRKNELDSIYYEIMGYEEEVTDEETGEEKIEKTDGLKDKLEAAYSKLTNEIKKSELEVEKLVKESHAKLNQVIESQEENINNVIQTWERTYNSHSEKIRKLLPDALTAGLSSAYQEKRKTEINERDSSHSSFKLAILGIFATSLIPFSLNTYLFINGKSIEQIILDIPHTLFAILPVYVPLIWVAYSSSKKANLSKRLVEEYTHKEVLSKTFEGLSNQIESLGDSNDSRELRIKLLHNILDVSSENPGKLISDYNKADHPVLDALEKSAKLGEALDKVAKIPGLQKLAQAAEKNTNSILSRKKESIESAIESVSENQHTNKNNMENAAERTHAEPC